MGLKERCGDFVRIDEIDFEKMPYDKSARVLCPREEIVDIVKVRGPNGYTLVCFNERDGSNGRVGNICGHLDDYLRN